MHEFDLIKHFFKPRTYQRHDVAIGIGDDGAVTNIPTGQQLVTTTDTLVTGVHFPHDSSASAVAHKAVAVNLSDLAAMGAEPAWLSLSLSLPSMNQDWVNEFSSALQALTEYYSVQLIGGDTVQGPLSITITAQGFLPKEHALTRSGAKPGDYLYVTGTLGDAALGLDVVMSGKSVPSQHYNYICNRFYKPTPRVHAGTALRRIAHACIDVSDGLAGDIRQLLMASQVGAVIQVDKLPLSLAMRESVDEQQGLRYALAGGDDYELLFTLSEEQKGSLDMALANCDVPATCIGHLNGTAEKLELKYQAEDHPFSATGFQHFVAG